MKDEVFENKLNELVKEIGAIPTQDREKLIMLAKKTQQQRKAIKNSVTSLQESLDYLRVSIKYMIFDLEATRRENAYLRKLLDEKGKK